MMFPFRRTTPTRMTTVRFTTGIAAALLVLLVLLMLVSTASPASAHASLIETTPFDGQQLTASPDEVALTFNEDVQAPTGGLRVFDNAGQRVDSAIQREITTSTVAVAIDEALSDGGYIATYRVVSLDGHVIKGAFVFTVGADQSVDDETLAALFAGGGDTVVSIGAGVVRAADYLGVLLLVGATVWLLVVARSDEDRQEAARWVRRGAWLAVVATVFAVPVQAMLSSGLGVAGLTNLTLLGETLGGSVGVAAAIRLLAVLAALLLAHSDVGVPVLGAGTVALLSFVIDGHTRTVEPGALMIISDAIHLAAASVWLAGVVLLGLVIRRRRLADDPVGAAGVVARFSGLASWSLLAVVAAGSAMSWTNVRQLRALTSTDYGRSLMVKVSLVLLIALIGAYNNRRLVPLVRRLTTAPVDHADEVDRHAAAAWSRLGATVKFEAIGMVLVLAVTAFLVNLRPAAEEAGITGAYDAYVQMGDELSVNLVVDPNRAGRNEIHLYVFDATGRPVSDADVVGLTLLLDLPERELGPIERTPYVAGPGHWQVDGNDLALAGAWDLTVVLDIDRLTRKTVTIPVVVNP